MIRLTLRLPDELHKHLRAAAKDNRRSLNAEILWRLEHEPATEDEERSS